MKTNTDVIAQTNQRITRSIRVQNMSIECDKNTLRFLDKYTKKQGIELIGK